jgi:hypothetical protein
MPSSGPARMTPKRPPLGRRFGFSLVLTLALTLGFASSASAAVTGLELSGVGRTGPFSSVGSIGVDCTEGKRVLGAAGEISASDPRTFGQVRLDDIRPNASLTGVTVQGLADQDGTPSTWFLTSYAICANPIAGLVRISATSTLDSANKRVTAPCPAGKRVVGAGGDINAGNGQVLMDDLHPNSSLTGVTVQGVEDGDGFTGIWSLTAYAICADPVAGLERVSTTSPLDSAPGKSVSANCPAGKQVVGAGGDVNAGNGQVVIPAITPNLALTRVTTPAVEDQDGFTGPWSVTAHAVCAST